MDREPKDGGLTSCLRDLMGSSHTAWENHSHFPSTQSGSQVVLREPIPTTQRVLKNMKKPIYWQALMIFFFFYRSQPSVLPTSTSALMHTREKACRSCMLVSQHLRAEHCIQLLAARLWLQEQRNVIHRDPLIRQACWSGSFVSGRTLGHAIAVAVISDHLLPGRTSKIQFSVAEVAC